MNDSHASFERLMEPVKLALSPDSSVGHARPTDESPMSPSSSDFGVKRRGPESTTTRD